MDEDWVVKLMEFICWFAIVLMAACIVVMLAGCAKRPAAVKIANGCQNAPRIQIPPGCYVQYLPNVTEVRCGKSVYTYKCVEPSR